MDMNVDLELEMKISRSELRLLLLHEFHLGLKITEATSNICGMTGRDVLSLRTAQYCFHRFKSGSFELNDLPHTRRPLQVGMGLSVLALSRNSGILIEL